MQRVLSIIIPTHNRPRILQKTLDCLSVQTFKNFEVIVVSDGRDDKTAEMFAGLEWPFPIHYFAIPKSQQGVCRNRALEKAKGKYVLLIGDDIFLAPDACERHMKVHQKLCYAERSNESETREAESKHLVGSRLQSLKLRGASTTFTRAKARAHSAQHDVIVLGFTTWDPSLKITPLMQWMERSGVQFGYPKIEKYKNQFLPRDTQHWFTYTSNISLPAKLFWKNPFREDISLYGWEDVEWGKRLADQDISLFYEPNAKAYHHHQWTNDEVWERSKLLGESAVKMEKIVPVLQLIPRRLKLLTYHLFAFFPTYRGKHCRMFLQGMKQR